MISKARMVGETTSLPNLRERVDELLVWARARIDQCRREEHKFMTAPKSALHVSVVVLEAATERRALQAVLRMLEGNDDTD